MSRYRARFGDKKVVLPVIHATSEAQVLQNVRRAVTAGADGVFLINHDVSAQELLRFHDEVRRLHPSLWVGVNCLEHHPSWVIERPDVAGVWADYAGDFSLGMPPVGDGWRKLPPGGSWDGLYFGGVAFKGQRRVLPADLPKVTLRAAEWMDVVTTSGLGTGQAADVEKVRVMREALGSAPLALASGVTPDNVREYLPYVNAFLVASGISLDFENLDLNRTRRLVDLVAAG